MEGAFDDWVEVLLGVALWFGCRAGWVGDPQGFGMAAPEAPSPDDVRRSAVPELRDSAMASIMGSCTLRYMLESAAKPPGIFSNCDRARS